MSDSNVWPRLTEVFRRVFRRPDLQIQAGTSAWDVPGWDSIAHLQLILGIEKEFAIEFEIREIAGIESAGQLAECIARKVPST